MAAALTGTLGTIAFELLLDRINSSQDKKQGTNKHTEYEFSSQETHSNGKIKIFFRIFLPLVMIGTIVAAWPDIQNAILESSVSSTEGNDYTDTSIDQSTSTDSSEDSILESNNEEISDDLYTSTNHNISEITLPEDVATYNGHSYFIYDYHHEGLTSWDDCVAFCTERGGYLAVIESQEENDFIYKYVQESNHESVFFGYTDKDHEGNWVWVNGSESTYTNWNTGQPNNGANNGNGETEHYAQFDQTPEDGTWNDAPFGRNTYYMICEWDFAK